MKTVISVNASLLVFAISFILQSSSSSSFVEARQWQSAIEHNIYRKYNIEKSRYSLKIEDDPFFFPEDVDSDDVPTIAPQGGKWVTLPPTVAPSDVPSDMPSFAPSEWNIERNGGCRYGHELFEVHMYDSWGDGWDSTLLVISGIEDQDPNMVLPSKSMTRTVVDQSGDTFVSIVRTINLDTQQSVFNFDGKVDIDPLGVFFQGTLTKGSHDYANICLLPRRCYQVTVAGGEFLNEVSWDIRPGNLTSDEPTEPILGGGAPSGCTFSLPDEYGHHFCANTCSNTLPPNAVTNPPKIIGNLQQNTASGSAAISEAHGEQVSTAFGTKRTGGDVDTGNGLKYRGYGSSAVLSNFEPVKDDENTNN
jgi:hypothetical protein